MLEQREVEVTDETVLETLPEGPESTDIEVLPEELESTENETVPAEVAAPETATEPPAPPVTDEVAEAKAMLAQLLAKIQSLKDGDVAEQFTRGISQAAGAAPTGTGEYIPKNHVAGKPSGSRYVLLSETLNSWGKVPQQQRDIADILVRSFEVGVPIPESDLFEAVTLLAKDYESLRKSVQHPTYLFRYYRGLKRKPNSNHAGYIARNFIQQLA